MDRPEQLFPGQPETLPDLNRYVEGVSRHTGTQAHRHSHGLDSYPFYI